MCSINRKCSDLEKNIYLDIQSEIYRFYDSQKMEYKSKEEPEGTLIDFLSYLYRLIPAYKRKVYYSKELRDKIHSNEISKELADILKKFDDAFTIGKDMNGFLSNNTNNPRKPDFLQYAWHLYHLHISDKFAENREQMKNNRSDVQLLCIITVEAVYFVDVINHPKKSEEYFNIKNLEIVANNRWMEKIGFYEVEDAIPGSIKPIITNDKDIFSLYRKGGNVGFEVNGKSYISLEPIMSNRRPKDSTTEFFRITKKIRILNDIKDKYVGFRFAVDLKNVLLGLVEFSTQKGESVFYNIF